MFYLLEDNRIIDEIEKAKKGQILYVVDNSLHCTSLYEKKWLGKIKKQSENVFDLIEVGDLVKLDKTINQVRAILEEKNKRNFFEIGDNRWFSFKELNYYLNANRCAIYKPDSKGNYIKVWEVKEDE